MEKSIGVSVVSCVIFFASGCTESPAARLTPEAPAAAPAQAEDSPIEKAARLESFEAPSKLRQAIHVGRVEHDE